MPKDEVERELRNATAEARRAFTSIALDYDAYLDEAHSSKHGSSRMIHALREANRIGKQMVDALYLYHGCVEQLRNFYMVRLKSTVRK
jgi:hypothetical protein